VSGRFAADSPLERRRFEPLVPRRIDDALETARFAFAALPVPPERPTRFATDGLKAENHVATVLDAGKAVPSPDRTRTRSPFIYWRRRSRPRDSRDITVPIGRPRICAVSW
jgi:hypothetical protein